MDSRKVCLLARSSGFAQEHRVNQVSNKVYGHIADRLIYSYLFILFFLNYHLNIVFRSKENEVKCKRPWNRKRAV